MNFVDLFAGAGGLSEGFVNAGFVPIAHIEADRKACDTLRTRQCYHYLVRKGRKELYRKYLQKTITREELYSAVFAHEPDSVIEESIERQSLPSIFSKIDKLLGKSRIDVIVGGPPCQAYSLAGRSRDPNRMRHDSRNYLFRLYAEFLKRYQPKYFIFENVTGLLSASNYLHKMIDLFESNNVGYRVKYSVFDAQDFGVLQSRKRVILIGRRGGPGFLFPEIKKIKNGWSVGRDLFRDLPTIRPGGGQAVMSYADRPNGYLRRFSIRKKGDVLAQHVARPHNKRDLEIYEIATQKWIFDRKRLSYNELPKRLKTHRNRRSFLDRFKVVDPFGSSHTIVAHIAKDGHHFIYPHQNQIRSLSVREAARIQSFPDDYFFEGGRTAAFRQIGNAVPPLMAEKIARVLRKLLTKN